MKVRVFDLTPEPPSPDHEPQETPLLGAVEGGLVVQLGTTSGRIAYENVVALALFRSLERGSEQLFLLFFLNGRPRPLVVEATRVRFHEFSSRTPASIAENIRQVGIQFCRQAGSLLVDRDTLTFLKSGGTPPLLETGMASLAASYGKVLRRPTASGPKTATAGQGAKPAAPEPAAPKPATPEPAAPEPAAPEPAHQISSHQTRPIPPATAAELSGNFPQPTPVMTHPMPAMSPSAPPARPAQHMVAPPTPASTPPASTPPPNIEPAAIFQAMEVQVFDPVLDVEELMYLPQDVSVGGSAEGLNINPMGQVAFTDILGLSIFSSDERGPGNYLMLIAQGMPRPLIAEARQVQFSDFPIQHSTVAAEGLRQWVLYACQKAGKMVMDRATGIFLQQGGLAPRLEPTILAMATALGKVLTPTPTPAIIPGLGPDVFGFTPTAPNPALASAQTLAAPEPSSAPSKGESVPKKPYSQMEALAYPVRGLCLMAFVGTVMFSMVSIGLTGEDNLQIGRPSGISLLFNLVAMWFLPPIFFGIIRSTASGENTLDSLPGFFDFEARFQDLIAYLMVGLIPGTLGILISLGVRATVGTTPARPESVGIVVAALVAYLFLFGIWLMATGAIAVYGDIKLAFHIDLHFKALRAAWKAVLMIVLRGVLFIAIGVILAAALVMYAYTPNLTSMSGILVALAPILFLTWYIALDSWHFVGLIFRQQKQQLAKIYLRA